MSVQGIVPFSFKGENFYTHSSWFSEKQYNGWYSVPRENSNLALYYSLSTLALVGILGRRTALVRSLFTSYGRLFTGTTALLAGSYLGWLGLLKSGESSEFTRIVSRNDCGSTPLWKSQEAVVNLREKDYKAFMSRREGTVYGAGDVKAFKPDGVLLGKAASSSVESV